ncbi:MAG TPA: efflux transporter outer membrane subunit, partial [Thermoanaerobaculia bacterium]|nr:efflux transporter outer membrane subunit [Thermoanaerobaculia bacterium]
AGPEAEPARPATEPAAAPAAPPATELRWQDFFTDARLRTLIELALANNRDLRVATLNIERAAALYRIQRAEVNPTIGVQATGDKYRIPEKMGDKGESKMVTAYTAVVGLATWELDLFGRLRSMSAASFEQYLATEEARRAAQISLVAAVAGSYLTLAADGENLRLARVTLEAQQASYGLIRATRDAGIASDLDLRQAESQVEAARVNVAAFTGAVAVDRNALELLVGTPVAPDLLPGEFGAVTDARGVSAGLSSDVLLCRPDILAAEHRLRAANANIGAARAAFFPRISLTASYGTQGPELSDLFTAGTRTWTFVPQIVAPLFASGSLLASLKASKVDREIAVALYEKAIQTAFAEVSDALTLRTTLVAQREAQEALVVALEETWRLYDARYQAGIDSYLGVLVAQQALFNAQKGEVSVRLAEQVNLVTLYKVLGGGV